MLSIRSHKGPSVLWVDKPDYAERMESILQDQSTFRLIDHDPTLVDEDPLIRLLLRMRKKCFITNDEYNLARPASPRPPRLYGLPKLHKPNYLLRPVMSASKTIGYGLG